MTPAAGTGQHRRGPEGGAGTAAAGRPATIRHASRWQAWRWVPLVAAGWLPGQPARASRPQASAGWRIVTANQADGRVTWRRRERTAAGPRVWPLISAPTG